MPTKTDVCFTPRTMDFLRALAANNTRDWFNENKSVYEFDASQPGLGFGT